MKLSYMCLDSALELWPPGLFERVFFASRIEHPEILGVFSYVVKSPEWVSFQHSKRQEPRRLP